MKKALFIILPIFSHYNMTYGLAKQLQEQGYKVYFTGIEPMKTAIQCHNFEFIPVRYVSKYLINNVKLGFKLLIKTILNRKFTIKRYKLFLEEIDSISSVCRSLKPQKVFIDSHLSYYCPLLAPLTPELSVISTKLNAQINSTSVPLSSTYRFGNYFFSEVLTAIVWRYSEMVDSINNFSNFFWLCGKSDSFFFRKLYRNSKFELPHSVLNNLGCYKNLDSYNVINLAPASLDYPERIPLTNESFKIFKPVGIVSNISTLDSLLYELKHTYAEKNKKIVFCSLGTLEHNNFEESLSFLQKICVVASELEEILFLIASNQHSKESINVNKSRNVLIFRNLPQIEILKIADLMITHGGLNSITECIWTETPMLVCPMNLKSDQPGNGARVQYHKIGLVSSIKEKNIKAIKIKIESLLKEESWRSNISSMKKSIPYIQ